MKDRNTLEKVLGYTNGELSRSDSKFRNVGTVNSLLIGAFVAVILYAMKYETGAAKIAINAVCGTFLGFNVISVTICIFGIWPREKHIHGAYDARFTSKKKYLKNIGDEYYSDKRLRFTIEVNSEAIIKKRKQLIVAIMFTLMPISLVMHALISKQNRAAKERYEKFVATKDKSATGLIKAPKNKKK